MASPTSPTFSLNTTAPAPPPTKRRLLPHPFAKSSPTPTPLGISLSGNFVETTSEIAAKALRTHWEEMDPDGVGFDVVSYTDAEGRKMFRIRPKDPPSPSSSASSSSPTTLPFARSSHQPPAPAIQIQPSTPQRQLRTTRSIPLLRRGRADTASSVSQSQSHSKERQVRKVGSSPSLRTQTSSSSLSQAEEREGGGGSQGDVLGRLLGWSSTPPGQGRRGGGTGKLELPKGMREGGGTAAAADGLGLGLDGVELDGLPEDFQELTVDRRSASENLPYQSPTERPTLKRSNTSPTISPFGADVRVPYRKEKEKEKATEQIRPMREVASTETIRTSKPEKTKEKRKRFVDPRVFDVFQSMDDSITSPPQPTGHDRLPSSSSISSSISSISNAARLITVTTAPGDDPRFVIWGLKNEPIPPTSPPPPGGRRGSVIPSGSERGGSPVASSPATTSSTRWSGSSPATSYRESIGSTSGGVGSPKPNLNSPRHEKVLLAATVERLVAELTSKLDTELLSSFFLTYRSFIRPIDLMRLLITRFEWGMDLSITSTPEDEAGRRIVRVRTFVVIRHWLLNHFVDDFVPDPRLRKTLTEWLNRCSKEARFRDSPRDERLIKGLKKACKIMKANHRVVGLEETEEVGRYLETQKEGGGGDSDVDLDLKSLSTAATTTTGTSLLQFSPPSTTGTFSRAQGRQLAPTTTFESSRPTSQAFPLPNSQNAISRSFTSALGTFGRLKRILSARTSSSSSAVNCVGGEAFDEEVEFEEGATGDLLWVKGGLQRYLEYYDIGGVQEEVEREEEETRSQDSEDQPEVSVVRMDEEKEEEFDEKEPHVETIVPFQLRPGEMAAISFGSDGPSTLPSTSSSAYDLLQPQSHHGGDFLFGRPTSTRIQLDDVDLSDEDEDVVEVKRTLKRLPATQNLRIASTVKPLNPYRESADSDSSYGSPRYPSFSRPEHDSVASYVDEDDNDGLLVPHEVVKGFVLEGLDDSDDEPGDVEAALRRLEGLVDDSREREKARKVERQMAKSATIAQADKRASNATSTTTRSSVASVASSAQSINEPTLVIPPADRDATVVQDSVVVTPASPKSVTVSQKQANDNVQHVSGTPRVHPRTLARKTGPTRQPSIANFLTRPQSTVRPPPPAHRSFILGCRTEVLAQQFCLIERDMLRMLNWQELVGGTWRKHQQQPEVLDWELSLKERRKEELAAKERGERVHSDVQAVIARFNLTANWVCSEILLTANPADRVAVLNKFIRLAFRCYCQSNFQTMFQICSGLQLPEISKLKQSWARIGGWEKRKFAGMLSAMSAVKNFRFLREVSSFLMAEYGPNRTAAATDIRPSTLRVLKAAPAPTGCIPFLGLFLHDLTLIDALLTWLDPTSPQTPAEVDAQGMLLRVAQPAEFSHLPPLPESMPLQPLVNLHKSRLVADVVHRILAFQEFAKGYPFEVDSTVYFKCLKIRALDFNTIRDLSSKLAAS